jgi:hypothetical protein
VTCTITNPNGKAVTKGDLSTELKLEPVSEKCHAVVAGITKTATFTMNGCYYLYNATETVKEEGRVLENPVDFTIGCPAGKQIEVHIYEAKENEEKTLCTYDVKAQGPLSGLSLTSNTNQPTSVNDITIDANVTTIAATNTKLSAICGMSEVVTSSYKGESTLRATNAKGEYVDMLGGVKKRFMFGQKPAVATGEKGTAEITTEKGPIKCTNVHYVGTAQAQLETQLTVTPSYSGCTAFNLTTDVYFEGCTYTFTLIPGTFGDGKQPKGTAVGQTHTKGPVHIECPEGTAITIQPTEGGNVKCTISIQPQTPSGEVDTKNMQGGKSSEDYVLFTNTVTGLAYEVEGSPATCGENAVTLIDGALHGTINVNGFEDKGGNPPATGAKVNFRIGGQLDPK